MASKPQRHEEELSQEICRICHDQLSYSDNVAEPCGCRGSARYVHVNCIMAWVNETESYVCEVCRQPYDLIITYKHSMLTYLLFSLFVTAANNGNTGFLTVLLAFIDLTALNSFGLWIQSTFLVKLGMWPIGDDYDETEFMSMAQCIMYLVITSAYMVNKCWRSVYRNWKMLSEEDEIITFRTVTLTRNESNGGA